MTREYFWALITLVIAIILALILLSIFHEPRSQVADLAPSKYDEHLLELDKEALEKAYHAQLQLLFSVWLRDDIGTTHRVENGLRIARRAYIHAADKIAQRADELAKRKGGNK